MSNLKYELNNANPAERKHFIRRMFDSIVPTYDLLNRMLSMGIDRSWRRFLISLMGDLSRRSVLDMCCGTGDLSNQIRKAGADLYSLDFSLPMIVKGRKKGWLGRQNVAADASVLPFKRGRFNYLTISFGIRNIPDLDNFIEESFAVLKPGGSLIILELTRPDGFFVSLLYNFYLRVLLPVVGGIVSGKITAYRYLSKTIATFVDPHDLASRIKSHGFAGVDIYRKTFGIATILVCWKDNNEKASVYH